MIRLIVILFIPSLLLYGCSGCSKSGRYTKNKESSHPLPSVSSKERNLDKCVVKMIKEDGVYKIPVSVNGDPMIFIFDTGAGMISISNVEANYLYKQGKLNKSDILGTAKFSDANGDISVGTVIVLREITIGSRTIYNIQASVVDNSLAPLLFGQSALQEFGKISIDYNNSTITFE